jgi:hypothetical protein
MTDRRDNPVDKTKGTVRPTPDGIEIDLRDPFVAGILAWIWPGAGHLYQRRYAKGALFMVCILGTFFFGLVLGEGKVVYASQFRDSSKRIEGVSGYLSAMPAVAQALVAKRGGQPMFGGWMASPENPEELNRWNKEMGTRYDLALLYTIIAGLLNWLAIYDAAAGPAFSEPTEKEKKDGKSKEDKDGKTKDKPE